MKQSMRAKRMARHHKRQSQQAKLSLVSLMDIFTILVFFLLLNSSDVQVLDSHKSVSLPQSMADTAAKETLLILVSAEDIVLQGKPLTTVPEALALTQDTIPLLADELAYHQSKISHLVKGDETSPVQDAITIMGDASVPYALLKKIMNTCAEAGYTDVALAVEQVAGQPEAGS